jgi:hypothetical protein
MTTTENKIQTTQEVIESQLLENTGTHFLDSGGTDNRGWQKSQKNGLNFEGLVIDKYSVSIPTEMFMKTMLKYTKQCNSIEQAFKVEGIDLCYSNSQEIQEFLENNFEAAFSDYGKDWFNTYNWQNDLTRVLQGVIFEINRKYFLMVETHNGADVRGGYSDARVYEIKDLDYFHTGQIVEVQNPMEPDGNPFETFYQAEKAGMYYHEKRKEWVFKVGRKIVPAEFYTPALGF